MSAEVGRTAERSFLGPPLMFATRVALAFPWATVVVSLGLALLAVVYTSTRLGYKTSRLDLLDPESEYNRRWVDYIEEFGEDDDAIVVVEGADKAAVEPVLEEVADQLKTHDRLFHAVLCDVDLSQLQAKGLHYLSLEELAGIEQFAGRTAPLVQGGSTQLNLFQLVSQMRAQLDAPISDDERAAIVDQIERLSAGLLGALESTGAYRSPWPEVSDSFATLSELNSGYLLANEGRLGFVLLRLADQGAGFTRNSEAADALRQLIAQTGSRHPEVSIGLTGLPIMENDEMRSSQSSMYWASVLSLGGVALLFVAGFGGLRHALLANLVLLVGIAWSFGYATLAVGHLNILSMAFTVTLIGIGIDYGVYYVSRYLQTRRTERDCRAALLTTSESVGPAILTGAITTSVAFFAAGFASFPGVAELGLIAGGGILLCAAAELLLLPAVLAIVDQGAFAFRMPEPLPAERWINPWLKAPRLLLCGAALGTFALAIGFDKLWYDHNLLNLQAAGLESVELEKRLLTESGQSSWYALSIAEDEDALRARAAAFRKLPSVERTEDIVQFFPVDQAEKQPIIARIDASLSELPELPSVIPVDKPERLGAALGEIQQLLADSIDGRRAVQLLRRVREALRGRSPEECHRCLREYQQAMAGELLTRLKTLYEIADPNPIVQEDLPPEMVDRFVGRHGRHLLRIYGKGNIWDMDALERFVRDVRSVDPQATGNPLQAYEASLEMQASYRQSAFYALGVIVVVLLIDLRSISTALLALAPLSLGMIQTFGLMGWLGIPLNPANTIALPLILGIGVDYGVHIIHEFRESNGPYRLSHATAIAVLVDALTTIVGFGSLMIASHEGLRSLGRVLTLGVSCCLFSSMVILPAALAWRTRNRETSDNEFRRSNSPGRPARRGPRLEFPGAEIDVSPAAAYRESPVQAR